MMKIPESTAAAVSGPPNNGINGTVRSSATAATHKYILAAEPGSQVATRDARSAIRPATIGARIAAGGANVAYVPSATANR